MANGLRNMLQYNNLKPESESSKVFHFFVDYGWDTA